MITILVLIRVIPLIILLLNPAQILSPSEEIAYSPIAGKHVIIPEISLQQNNFTKITSGPHVTNSTRSSGVCWVDFNNDGYLDIYETNARFPDMENNCLYENNGDGTFTRITDLEIVNDDNFSTGAVWADYDNDNDLDLFVSAHRTHPNLFYINNGSGIFTLNTLTPLDDSIVGSTSASWIDYDNDSYLDLFVGNSTCGSCTGYPPYRNFLFKNIDGLFTEILSGDIVTDEKYTYGAVWCDYDNDGDVDLLAPGNISMNEYPDLYRNENGTNFTYLSSSIICQTMGIGDAAAWGDYNNDGRIDIFFTADYPGPGPLYKNEGDGIFSEITNHGLGLRDGQPLNGSWADYDNDGDLDILIWNNIFEYGGVTDTCYAYLFDNDNGLFTKNEDPLIYSDSSLISTVVWGDYDRDGDLDLYVPMFRISQVGSSNMFYQNNGNDNNWVTIKCIAVESNRSAIGTKIRIKADISGEQVWQVRELTTQSRASTQPPMEAHFGLGDASLIDTILVEWPGGIIQVLENIAVNQFFEITESCCKGIRGNVDNDILDQVDIGDLVYFVEYSFINPPGPEPECFDEADVDINDELDIGDIVYLVEYQFLFGPPPPACID